MKLLVITVLLFLIASCEFVVDVEYPFVDSSGFMNQTDPLSNDSKSLMEGVYKVIEGNEYFGNNIVLKVSGEKLSAFTNKNVGYMIFQAGSLDSVIYCSGYWRFGAGTETGLINFTISSSEGASNILAGDTTNLQIKIRGEFGDGNNPPDKTFQLEYMRPFSDSVKQDNFFILAHRGGGRNSDNLQASENSVEIISLAEKLGANGIEIDIRLTKDGIPILYHDSDINLRLTQKSVIWGNIEDFTFAQLRTFVRLINGEKIPSLEEALEYVLNHTDLRFVWLDLKSERNEIPAVIKIQKDFLRRANSMQKDLQIVLGIPSVEKANQILLHHKYEDVTTLCELGLSFVRELNSIVWAPRWTQGLQLAEVREIHGEGRKAFVWTLDEPVFIQSFINEGEFDGILTNHPTLVAYYHYIRE
jgi:glycerophosphoryl diester phosphodiesterase